MENRIGVKTDAVPLHRGGSPAFRKNVLDLGVASELNSKDRLGNAATLEVVKRLIWGDATADIALAMAEAFFSDESNFVTEPGDSHLV